MVSLLLAADLRPMAALLVVFILFLMVVSLSTFRMRVLVLVLQFLEHAYLILLISDIVAGTLLLVWSLHKHFFKSLNFLWLGNGIWEGNREAHKEISELVALLVEGHSEAVARHERIGLDDLSGLRFNSDLPPVKVHERELKTSQCFQQGYLLLVDEVGALALEKLVLFLQNDNHDISSIHIRQVVGLAMQYLLVVVRCALVDRDLDFVHFLVDFLSLALLALFCLVDDFACLVALIAGYHLLSNHARANLSHHHLHAASLAGRAFLNCCSISTTNPIA